MTSNLNADSTDPAAAGTEGRPTGQPEGPAPRAEGSRGRRWLLATAAAALLPAMVAAASLVDFSWTMPALKLKGVRGGDAIVATVASWDGRPTTYLFRLARATCREEGEAAYEARRFTAERLEGARITIAPLGNDEEGRAILCEIFYITKGKTRCLSDDLVAEGLAMRGRRAPDKGEDR